MHPRPFWIVALAAALLGTPTLAGAQTSVDSAERGPLFNPHTAVSSDGSLDVAERTTFGPIAWDAYEGTAPDGFADDSQAEFSSREESAEEVWALTEHQPIPSPFGRESIIGADNRARVKPTTGFPARAIGWLLYSQRGLSFFCSGWLISPNTVVTAGHCVFGDGNLGGSRQWSTNVVFYPGRNGSSSPFGSCSARSLYSVTGWTNGGGNEEYDYGAIKLNCTVGNTTGWFGFWSQSATLNGRSERLAGYAGDKPWGQQWRSDGTIGATTTRQVFYPNDTFGGMSGSPVYPPTGSGTKCPGGLGCGFAIHTQGLHGSGNHATKNHGTRITKSVATNLISWINKP